MRLRRSPLAPALFAATLATAPGVHAQTGPESSPAAPAGEELDELEQLLEQAGDTGSLGGWEDRPVERPRSFPWVEHHGYFRFRADLFYNGHLGTVIPGVPGTGTSAIPAPITENVVNNDGTSAFGEAVGSDDGTTIASANIRFRYSPTIHVARSMRIHATIDFLDNVVLGSTPDYAGYLLRPDVPLVAFSDAAVPPASGVNGFQDGVRVKEAYAEWQPAFLLRVGRQASHWGLGILANAGNEIDDDFGDYTDRALVLLKLYGVYVSGAWDYIYSGATTAGPGDFFGQAKDLGQADDVTQWVFSVFQRPLSEEELAQRNVAFNENLRPAFDWGLYAIFRQQDFDLTDASRLEALAAGGRASFDQLRLVPRDAWAFIPDLWLRFAKRFDYSSGIRVELEAAAVFGEIDNVVGDNVAVAGPSRSIEQFGAALEIEYDRNDLSIGLDAGFATGDATGGFGVQDRAGLSNLDGTPNRNLTAFKFDRDYQIDLMLFREVIGTVTNAVYIKPYVKYDLFESVETALGARLDLLYARALEPEATPGRDPFLGLEADLRLFYQEKDRFSFDLEAGFLLPGGAFDYRPVGAADLVREAEFAFTVQSRLTLLF